VPDLPDIPGIDSDSVVEMYQVMKEEVDVGENVLVVAIQHHMHGLQMADLLTENGKKVRLLSTSAYAGDKVDVLTLEDIYTRLLGKGVIFTPLTGIREIRGSVVITYNVLTGAEESIEDVDTVVFCTHGKPNDSLYRSLKGKIKELHQVGQCVTPREFLDSVYDGTFTGRAL
jgi:hypothetical protein